MPAHAAYAWVQTHFKKPFLVPVGTVQRRGKPGSAVISGYLDQRKPLFLCASCEAKMPWRWLRRWEYRLIPGLSAAGTRCDSCQLPEQSTNVFYPEDQGYYQQHLRAERIRRNAAAQRVLVRDGKRIPGT